MFARVVRAAALAYAGRLREAHEAVDAIFDIDPTFSAAKMDHYPFPPSHKQHLLTGLTMAGLSEASAVLAATDAASPAAGLPLPDKPSIAVLPFQNMSGDPEQEYFADGMAEDIITALSRFKQLFVIARNSSFTYKGKAIDIKQVGRELGVRYVLEGSVRKAGARVRVTGQLIEAASNSHLWADRFDATQDDIFEMQDKVTESVVAAIAPMIHDAEMKRAQGAQNPDAHELFWRALSAFHRARPSDAVVLCRQAIELSPTFAGAHALAAASLTLLNLEASVAGRDSGASEALSCAETALALDASDPEIMARAGMALGVFGDKALGLYWLDRAVTINPNFAFAWRIRGSMSYLWDAVEKAPACFANALRLDPSDPLNFIALSGLSIAHYFLSHYDEALHWAEQGVMLGPTSIITLRALAASAALSGNSRKASSATERILQIAPGTTLASVTAYLRQLGMVPQRVDRFVDGLRLAGLPE
jgi:TolB-like protein